MGKGKKDKSSEKQGDAVSGGNSLNAQSTPDTTSALTVPRQDTPAPEEFKEQGKKSKTASSTSKKSKKSTTPVENKTAVTISDAKTPVAEVDGTIEAMPSTPSSLESVKEEIVEEEIQAKKSNDTVPGDSNAYKGDAEEEKSSEVDSPQNQTRNNSPAITEPAPISNYTDSSLESSSSQTPDSVIETTDQFVATTADALANHTELSASKEQVNNLLALLSETKTKEEAQSVKNQIIKAVVGFYNATIALFNSLSNEERANSTIENFIKKTDLLDQATLAQTQNYSEFVAALPYIGPVCIVYSEKNTSEQNERIIEDANIAVATAMVPDLYAKAIVTDPTDAAFEELAQEIVSLQDQAYQSVPEEAFVDFQKMQFAHIIHKALNVLDSQKIGLGFISVVNKELGNNDNTTFIKNWLKFTNNIDEIAQKLIAANANNPNNGLLTNLERVFIDEAKEYCLNNTPRVAAGTPNITHKYSNERLSPAKTLDLIDPDRHVQQVLSNSVQAPAQAQTPGFSPT